MSVAPEYSPVVTRRSFLASVSAGSLILMGKTAWGQAGLANASKTDVETFAPDFFVSISPDGTVTCLAHRSEMGTGIRTGLPRVIADELEADWDRVVIQQAIGDKRLGDQNTDGSNSIRFFFNRMRVAGATARTMLEQAAAKKWGVDASRCYADMHEVKLRGSNRKLGFGELVATAQTLDVPTEAELQLKPRSKWRYIGKDVPITDLDDIVSGKAVYGIDAHMDNQLYAIVARPPVVGGKVKSFDATAAKKIPGVVDAIEIPAFQGAPMFQPLGGVAVLANSTWAAWQGRDALEIQWDHGANADYDTDEFAKQLEGYREQTGANSAFRRRCQQRNRDRQESGQSRLFGSAPVSRSHGNSMHRSRREDRCRRQSYILSRSLCNTKPTSGPASRWTGAGHEERRRFGERNVVGCRIWTQEQARLLRRSSDVVEANETSGTRHMDSRRRSVA